MHRKLNLFNSWQKKNSITAINCDANEMKARCRPFGNWKQLPRIIRAIDCECKSKITVTIRKKAIVPIFREVSTNREVYQRINSKLLVHLLWVVIHFISRKIDTSSLLIELKFYEKRSLSWMISLCSKNVREEIIFLFNF